jgi:hypothetical protein
MIFPFPSSPHCAPIIARTGAEVRGAGFTAVAYHPLLSAGKRVESLGNFPLLDMKFCPKLTVDAQQLAVIEATPHLMTMMHSAERGEEPLWTLHLQKDVILRDFHSALTEASLSPIS